MVGRLGLAPSIASANGFTVRPIAISGHHPSSLVGYGIEP